MRRTKRMAAVCAASALMATGAALAAPGTAAAADRYDGPTLTAEQGDFGGKNVTLTLTNPNASDGLLSVSACTSALLDGTQALEAFVAYNAKDYGALIEIVTAPGVTVGPTAANSVVSPGPNSASTTTQKADGVYLFLGTCGGLDTALNPDNVGISLVPVIVPAGIGGLVPLMNFGSTALEAGVGSADLLPLLGVG